MLMRRGRRNNGKQNISKLNLKEMHEVTKKQTFILTFMLQLSPRRLTWPMIAQFLVFPEWRVVTVRHLSPFCPSNAHWNVGQKRGQEQLASAFRRTLRAGASCQSDSWVDPNNVVGILLEPRIALWRLDYGSQETKIKCIPVCPKRSMTKKTSSWSYLSFKL